MMGLAEQYLPRRSMDSSSTASPHRLLYLLILISASQVQGASKHRALNNSVSALFVFGDSTADPGNNNYVKTLFRSNFLPYGRDFRYQVPTGRFTNGRLASDYMISYVGIKDYVPPYLDPTLSIDELMTGVSFASAGSGFDPLTPTISGVISLPQQLEFFKEYKKRLDDKVGKKKTESIVTNAVFIVAAGTNDFVVNYFTLPVRRKSFTVSAYQQFVLQHVKDFIQGLNKEGARRIAVVGLPPMGCLPVVITLNSVNAFVGRQCLDSFSSVARDYNALLQTQLAQMQNNQTDHRLKLYYADIYGPIEDAIEHSKLYGYEEVSTGCCGTGLLEAAFLCNQKSPICSDASKYVFWDSIHPTEKTYFYVFVSLRRVIDNILMDM